jgi:hypothetical protein
MLSMVRPQLSSMADGCQARIKTTCLSALLLSYGDWVTSSPCFCSSADGIICSCCCCCLQGGG